MIRFPISYLACIAVFVDCLGEECCKQRQRPGAKALQPGKAGSHGEHGEPAKGPHGLPEPTPNQTSVQEMRADSAFRGLGSDVERDMRSGITQTGFNSCRSTY